MTEARQRAAALSSRAGASQPDLAEARRWLDRARRLAPQDPTGLFLLATICLRLGDREAETLFAELARSHEVREVWAGLAASRRASGDLAGALEAAAACLSRHAPFPAIVALAPALVAGAGLAGWCGLDGAGTLTVQSAGGPDIRLDGVPVAWRQAAPKLPPVWQQARWLTVASDGRDLLGSPIDIQSIRRLEGFVTERDGGIAGWAWHPHDPDRPPELTLLDGDRRRRLDTDAASHALPGTVLLGRPHGFSAPIARGSAPLRVVDRDGRDLLGSPLGLTSAQGTGRRARRPAAEATGITVLLVMDDTSEDAEAALARLQHGVGPDFHVIAATAEAGLRQTIGRDVALVRSGTHLMPGWLDRLRTACHAAPDIGSASPLHLTTPARLEQMAHLAAQRAPVDWTPEQEHCVYLRQDCLAQVGALRSSLFAQGEGAIIDLCLRAEALGWRHVALPGMVMARDEVANQGPAWAELATRNQALLARLHPARRHTPGAVAGHRRHLAAAALRAASGPAKAVLLISHGDGGGVERLMRLRCDQWRAQGKRPLILRPGPRPAGSDDSPDWCVLCDGPEDGRDGDLRFHLPRELPALAALLRSMGTDLIEVHHLLGHRHAVMDLAKRLAVPYDFFVHDHASFCPRIVLLGRDRRYCGEPALRGCEACVAELGHHLEEKIGVAALRRRSTADLAAARRVVVPSQDTAHRLRRHFPAIRAAVTPWEPDAAPAALPAPGRALVCVAGAIGIAKGFEILLACARDSAERALDLRFIVVGHTIDDGTLMDTGRVFVTGEYREAEAVTLIAAQRAAIGFVPSVAPETWCYTLSQLWAAGLPTVAFDIGAPAERIRRSGGGHILPLGLPPAAINQALLAYIPRLGFDQAPPARASAGIQVLSGI